MFNEDPVEFIRKINDSAEEWIDPRVAAINLLQMLARYRQKDTLPRLMPFMNSVLHEYETSPKSEATCIKKDGVLVAVATIQKILHESSSYSALIEPFLVAHVIPELQSPIPFLRARACWVIEYMNEELWHKESILRAVLTGLLQGLRDSALPVQTAAACSMRLLVEQEGAKDLVRPMLPEVVNEYFRIMEEAENDSVISALQTLVVNFGEEIQGIAASMVQRLSAAFFRFIATQNDDDDDATFAACGCLDTICVIIEEIGEVPAALQTIEPVVLPLVISVLNNTNELGYEFVDNVNTMLTFLTYYQDEISEGLFSCCTLLLAALKTWASDYISEIAGPLLNYISKATNRFFLATMPEGTPFHVALLGVIEQNILSTDGYEDDANAAAHLLACLQVCGNGMLNDQITRIFQLILQRLREKIKTKRLKCSLLNASLATICYDSLTVMSILRGDENHAHNYFGILFDALPGMESSFSRRLIVMAFTNILTIPLDALPFLASNNLENMYRQIIRELVFIQEEGADDEGHEAGGGSDDDEGEEVYHSGGHGKWKQALETLDVPDGGYDEDEDCVNAEDETYREALEKLDKEERVKRQLYIDGEPVDDDDDLDGYEFTSPLENIDVLGYFIDAMTSLAAKDSGRLNCLQSCLDVQDAERLQELVRLRNA